MEHPPPAPTPPSGMAPNGARSNNLLNLLKFSGAGQASAQQARQDPYQHLHHPQQQQQHSQHSLQEHEAYQYQQSQQHRQMQAYHPQGPDAELEEQNMPMSAPMPQQILAPAPAAQDPSGLLRALMGGAHDVDEPAHEAPAPVPVAANQPVSTFAAGPPPEDTRTYLLNLLNRPKPSQHDQPLMTESSRHGSYHSNQSADTHNDRGLHHLLETGSNTSSQHRQGSYDFDHRRSFEAPGQHPPYNPFAHHQDANASYTGYSTYDTQNASQNNTPKSGSATLAAPGSVHSAGQSPAAPAFHILKKAQESPSGSAHGSDRRSYVQERSPLASPEHLRRKGQSSASPAEHVPYATPGSTVSHSSIPHTERPREKETVSEAVHEIAEKANQEAKEAVARAEDHQSQPSYVKDLADMNAARTDSDFEEKAQQAAQAIKKELEREENEGVLESVVPPEVASEVHKIVDDVAGEGVADSWESADQDEIVVIEEEAPAPVKVFNFPMKPWISITVKGGAADLPQFRDESIMDIARLKKEFDQIDRNLYTATQIYMVYGMSKAGGLRVIRQEDGRDAKIFTDTKDRIFNVAVSVTPSDHDGVHREAIIGTGISGTVYWVQIRNGDKDHIEDAHPEQYGFALPPMSSHEGDAPGGVLKTRARSSTIHPEFFAVGRGKSINIIWPEYIMQNNLFKPGHDRVVDTEQLAKQCSLKINTGKAGKDFTFSQDDTVVVSLDKSGRVKFWDVRELTAAKEDGNPRAPTPKHTSLEVKDPLLTLTSTPEGEKAWPTSVLLVDKLRPYQKRCALRYMIVGMKQNHTLQLWDLALGKPVQEFNLPHSKESDAVCSVMYHPPTGMIVIGHPTRNSIYFAHLSAPKYTLKSVSQVEYIQKLVAQDSTIPQPDSTAVISGVREYSFANRGILRSLDILSSPAMSQDSDEPTLFELYAMHSKGVACLLVKQNELGWSKDNKVLAPVEAVDVGFITISKLKPPPSQAVEITNQESTPQPSVTRHIHKEPATHSSPSQQEESSRRAPESAAPAKAKQEAKEDETPPAPAAKEEKQEKQERKSRKKKAAAAAAAAASLAAEAPSNGGSQSPRVSPKDAKNNSSPPVNSITQESVEAYLSSMESRLNSSFAGTINAGLKSMNSKIEESHREREKDFDARQLNLLHMVSEVLNENTQKVLESLIQEQFASSVIPAISDVASRAVADQFNSNLNQQVSQSVHKEIHRALPSATQQALQGPEFIKSLTNRVSANVAQAVQHEIVDHLSAKLSASFSNMTRSACQSVAEELQRQHRTELDNIHAQRLADHSKMDQLSAVVTQLSNMVSALASSQEQFQGEFLRFQQQAVKQQQQHHQQAPQHVSPAAQQSYPGPQNQAYAQHQQARPPYQQSISSHSYNTMQSPENAASQRAATHYAPSHAGSMAPSHAHSMASTSQAMSHSNMGSLEYDQTLAERTGVIEALLKEGKIEEALLTWLQSGREHVIFDKFISKFGPQLLNGLPGLLLLTVATTISHNLESSTRDRVAWLESIVNTIQEDYKTLDADAKHMAPRIFELIIQKTEALFVRVSSTKGNDPILRNLSQLIGQSKKTLELCLASNQQQFS